MTKNKRYIKNKDEKILWSRAAGRCSMPDCRVMLTLDNEDKSSSTLGAMCHIVDLDSKGPRGKSQLTIEEKNSYSNLILLCSHHHDIIDSNIKKYTIEKLHQIKTTHELWVSESLSSTELDPDEIVFADIIDTIVLSLKLNHWSWFIDHAVRDLIHIDYLETRGILNTKLLGAVWPKSKSSLTKSIKDLIKSYSTFITHFEKRSEYKEDGMFLGPDLSYKRYWNKKYASFDRQNNRWSNNNFRYLADFVYRLNIFTKQVRLHINPMFFRVRGYFLIEDSIGYRFGGKNSLFKPTSTIVKKYMKEIENEDII